MDSQPLNGVLKHVRKVAAIQAARLELDHVLLQRFVAGNDEVALTALIERHGRMVMGVCRRALACVADAEDAFQATFLVFSVKASSIRDVGSVGNWLHGVALRIAGKMKREAARRKRRERSAPSTPVRTPAEEVTWAEVQTAVDEELQRLPERYRAVLILCYLDGKTRDEAARQLRISSGALHGLLERGRKLLADRLTRRGLTLSAGILGVGLSEAFGLAAVSPTQVVTTAHAAIRFAAGLPLGPHVSAEVYSLVHQFLKGVIMTKLKLVSSVAFCCVLSVSVIGIALAQTSNTDPTRGPNQQRAESNNLPAPINTAKDSDEEFIRRVSKALRGSDPTPAEIHFFLTSKDAKKRETLIDLFVQESEARRKAERLDEVLKRRQAELDRALADESKRKQADLENALNRRQADLERKKETDKLLEDRKKAIENANALIDLDAKKSAGGAPPSNTQHEAALLKTNVEIAKLAVREKQILLNAARSKNADETKIALLEIEVARAQLLVEQAEIALRNASKKPRE
jgi:RNA polymerase sigma factor (sigma-70 family)